MATARRPAIVLALCLGLACISSEERRLEQVYASRVTATFHRFETVHAAACAECQRGLLPCAVAAQEAAGAARSAKADVAALDPPRKLASAHRELLQALEQVALAYDAVADTFWNQDGAFEAHVRSVGHMERSIEHLLSAALDVGFNGDPKVWQRR